MFDPDPHIQRRSERCRTQSRERNREGPEHTDYGRKKEPNRGDERPTTTRESSQKNLDQDGLYKGATCMQFSVQTMS